ncbi:MAG: CHASE domain-containing protein [Minwuia sp.]|nr:CHASE domain-containing protein [Minwuia sp.]
MSVTEFLPENDQLKAERDSIQKSSRLHWFHWAVVILSLALIIGAWQFSSQQVQEKTQARFDRAATHTVDLITDRMRKYEEGLWGGVSAIHSHGGTMSRDEWRDFAAAMRIDLRFPGINGIGVIHQVAPRDLPVFVGLQRQLRPDFAVHPTHANSELLPITYIEPEQINAEAVGLDIAHEENRYTAAMKARDTGYAQITGPIVLVQDQSRTPGFLFYTPVYGDLLHDTVDERRHDFVGLVYAPFVFRNLIEGTLETSRRQVRIRISDGGETLYDEGNAARDADSNQNSAYAQVRSVEMYGRNWTFRIWPTDPFLEENASAQPQIILAGGFLIDGLLLLLFIFLTRANRRAIEFVDSATGQLRRKTTQLLRSNEELESFAYAASHDLKAPLRGIANLATWIREDLGDDVPGDVGKHVELLQGRVRRMENLLEDLLQYARAGRGTVAPQDVDLATELQDMFELIASSVDFRLDLQHPVPSVFTARTPLLQVFHNLVSNAIKHHDSKKGVIQVSAEDLGTHYRFKVSDDGPGISPDFHRKIFEIFQTLKGRDEVEASGIGLSIVKRIVLSAGGEIEVDSDPEKHRGTTFAFTWKKDWRETS